MIGLLPLLIALAIVESAAAGTAAPGAWRLALPWIGAGLGLVLLLGVGLSALWRRPQARWFERLDVAVQAALLGWLAWLCHGLGWVQPSGRTPYTLAVAPWVLALIAWWWSSAPVVARIGGPAWTRSALVLHHLRLALLPILLLLPVIDLCVLIGRWSGIEGWLVRRGLVEISSVAGAGLLGLLAVAFLPVALVRLWGAKPMPEGELRAQLGEACARAGVRVAGILRWPVAGGRMHNAALVGVIPRLRFVLFTDDLLRDLDRREVLAVLGHELGHARHGHLWTYLAFALLTVMVSYAVQDAVLPLLDGLPAARAHPGVTQLAVMLVLIAIQWRLVFGWISRACERQADLAGAELVGDPATMASALRAVARAAGQREDAPSWRHFSIAERISFLQHVAAMPAIAVLHHRMVRSLRMVLVSCCIGVAALTWLAWAYDPLQNASRAADPAASLSALQAADPALGAALAAADAGSPALLASWLAAAEPQRRQQLGLLVARQAGGLGDQPILADPRPARVHLGRLRPFIRISTGAPGLDLLLDNLTAYLLAVGDDLLPAGDLDEALAILPRLEAAAAASAGADALWDTIGCVRFRAGQWRLAEEAFARAAAQAAADPPELPALYRARLAASREAQRARPDGAPPPALPMETDIPRSATVPAETP